MMMTEILVSLFVLLQAGDYITTVKALKLGLTEGNPVLSKLFKKSRPEAALAVVKLIIVAATIIAAITGSLHDYALIALCVIYLAIVINNLIQIRRTTS